MSFGCCCDGGGPLGKRFGFTAGEKVGEAREPAQALRLRRGLWLRSMGTGDGARDEREVIGGGHTVGLNRASPSLAALTDGLRT